MRGERKLTLIILKALSHLWLHLLLRMCLTLLYVPRGLALFNYTIPIFPTILLIPPFLCDPPLLFLFRFPLLFESMKQTITQFIFNALLTIEILW